MIIYDGECYFCVGSVLFLKRHLTYFPQVRSSQSTPYSMTNLSERDTKRYVWYIKGHKYYRGHKVLAVLLRQQPELGRKALGWFMSVPPFSWMFSLGYLFVAKYRGRLSKIFFKKQMKAMCADC